MWMRPGYVQAIGYGTKCTDNKGSGSALLQNPPIVNLQESRPCLHNILRRDLSYFHGRWAVSGNQWRGEVTSLQFYRNLHEFHTLLSVLDMTFLGPPVQHAVGSQASFCLSIIWHWMWCQAQSGYFVSCWCENQCVLSESYATQNIYAFCFQSYTYILCMQWGRPRISADKPLRICKSEMATLFTPSLYSEKHPPDINRVPYKLNSWISSFHSKYILCVIAPGSHVIWVNLITSSFSN